MRYTGTTKYKKVSMPTNKYLNKCGMLEDNNNNGNNKKVKTAIMAKKEVEENNNKKKNKKKANKKRKRKQYYYFSRRLSEAKELDILLQDAEPRTFLQFRNVIDKWNHDNEKDNIGENDRFYCLKIPRFLFKNFKQYCLNFKQYFYPVKSLKKAMNGVVHYGSKWVVAFHGDGPWRPDQRARTPLGCSLSFP